MELLLIRGLPGSGKTTPAPTNTCTTNCTSCARALQPMPGLCLT